MAPNQGATLTFNGRHHLLSTSQLLPCSLCVYSVHWIWEISFPLSGGWWHRKSQKIRIPQQNPALPGESFLCSAVPCWLCPRPLLSARSCTPVPALLSVFGQATGCKTEAQLVCHVLTLASPVAAAFPNSWSSLKVGRDFNHHSNKTPKQPMKLSLLQDTPPQTANTGHEPLLRARLGIPNLKTPFHQLFFKPGFPYYYYYYYPSAILPREYFP